MLGLGVIAATIVVALSTGASPSRHKPAVAASTVPKHGSQTHTARASSGSTAAASTANTSTASTANSATSASTTSTLAPSTTIASSAPGSGAGDPVSAVKRFYTLAAAHRYAAAWGLADASMQSQLGGYQSFQSGQAGDRSITFTSAQTVSRTPSSARVAITTTSVRSTGTQHCAGTVDLVPGAQRGNWQLHEIGINCS